jgi:hypothetical protein
LGDEAGELCGGDSSVSIYNHHSTAAFSTSSIHKETTMSNFLTGTSYRDLLLGIKVDRATDNILTGEELFSVVGGRVQVNLIIGEVTTIIETKTVNFKLVADPTVGTNTDLCANLDLSADEAGTMYTISGAAATAMQRGESGSVLAQLTPVIVSAGAIEATVGATHTGSIKWSIFYVPIDAGAYVEAA